MQDEHGHDVDNGHIGWMALYSSSTSTNPKRPFSDEAGVFTVDALVGAAVLDELKILEEAELEHVIPASITLVTCSHR